MNQRHRFHSICPYFAMFPESFVEKHLAASPYSGVVFDPFCGRGTSIFQSLLVGRSAAGSDVNPVAVCISGAKASPPELKKCLARLDHLEADSKRKSVEKDWPDNLDEFFKLCFSDYTRAQVMYLRRHLKWRTRKDDRFIAAVALGALHGESHKSRNYFSNRMPRTISTKPNYSVGWWRGKRLTPPERDVFSVLRDVINYRYISSPPDCEGEVRLADAREASLAFPHLLGSVTDVITSPPYLDTTNYKEDQWLRLWFLGGAASAMHAPEDGRHVDRDLYWNFLEEAWAGISPLLSKRARIVVRIGGRKVSMAEAREGLIESLEEGLERKVYLVDAGVQSEISLSQANAFRGARVASGVEYDFCFYV